MEYRIALRGGTGDDVGAVSRIDLDGISDSVYVYQAVKILWDRKQCIERTVAKGMIRDGW